MAKSKFSEAFASARKSGKKEFSFGGKKYNTKLKEDGKKTPSKAPTPTSRSNAVSGMAKKQPSYSGLSDIAKNTPKKAAPKSTPVKSMPEKKKAGSGLSGPSPVGTGKPVVGTGKPVVGTGKRLVGSGGALSKKKGK